MSIEVKVPALPESVADASIASWHKKVGDFVKRDENLLDLETDKVVLEVPSPADGILTELLLPEGSVVKAGELLAKLEEGPAPAVKAEAEQKTQAKSDAQGPAVRRLAAEHEVSNTDLAQLAKDGRVSAADVRDFVSTQPSAPKPALVTSAGPREEKRVPMTRLRSKIAERLVQVKNETAMLTTFNEVNLQAVMNIRQQHQDAFVKKHGIKLGFMSFFTKAVVAALKQYPSVNASIDGNDTVYHGYFDVGIAVSTERGLVVPVIRDADTLSLAQIELQIQDYANKARAGKLALEDMQGGTFTITNGGIFGSMLSTPIINPPQTGILGMHKIMERPVAEHGQVVIRPMMYLALSYDHRLVDGKESVQFLVTVKDMLEDPARLLLDL
ncbi:MAG: 2-oxoglutarate dehydrogenase complex dihydrolipoyllysine-residue succinyltransferase [Gammaproteobacteria bacterium]|nr:2-oxoglutarate dehydrogenase complex dihydrolipoyllysine-residue succinyltransferase [Gammaproteobacteria bacterium]